MELFYNQIGTGKPLVILHGLFGSSDNWQSLAKQFGRHYQVILVDLRNHGRSPHDDSFNFEVMVDDLFELCQRLDLSDIILLGHSLGGKVAMNFARSHPDMLHKLIVVDIAPRAYPIHHMELINALNELDLPTIKSRNEADQLLQAKIPAFSTRQFLLKNLKRTSEGFEWKMNLPIIAQNLGQVMVGLDATEAVFEGPTLFINGGKSRYIEESDHPKIRTYFPQAILKQIDQVGHWVHAEAPKEFYEICMEFMM